MQRFLSMLAVVAFSFSMGTGAFAKSKSKATAAPTAAPAAMATITCPAGQTAVKGYKKKDGTTVKPYCRKAPSMKGSAPK